MNTTRLAGVLGLSLAACGGGMDPPPEVRSALAYDTTPAISDSDYAALVSGNNAFAADLYQQVRGDDTANLVFSPNSITTALAMTYAGANGDTATQMATTLHFTLPPATLHAGMDRLAQDLASRGSAATSGALPFALHEMDALWAQQDLAIAAPFLDTLATDYDAGVYQLDFAAAPDAARATINAWVADQTDQHIQGLMGPTSVDSSTQLALTNAIFFEAAWAAPFDPKNTAPGPFTTASGGSVQASYLGQDGTYPYAAGSDYQALELGYDGGQVAMDVLLPTGADAASLAAFEASLTGDRLATILGSLQSAPILLSLPKVNFSAALSLADTLKAMGMPAAFSDAADFSGITTTEPLFIQAVAHKGFVAVDEKGTTAAAATGVSIGTGAAPVGTAFTADHPYILVVRDLPTGTILFIGRVSDPTAS